MQEISEICVVETLPVDDINKLVDKRNRTIGHFVKDGDENNFLLSKQWILQTLKENESLYDGFPLPFLSLLISDGDLESLYNLSLILPDQLLYLTKLLLLVHPKSQPIWHLRLVFSLSDKVSLVGKPSTSAPLGHYRRKRTL